ncbi:MAG: hypothetical protein FWF81_13730 [Defluviitaleaceae bacterium]|nr:hypothetical protein [Defluviitaleaceae bacterium]
MNPDSLHDGNLDAGTKNKKGKGGIIALAIILVLVIGAVVVIALDIGNVRSEHIMGYLRNAPLVGSLFESAEDDEDPLYAMTEDEMRLEIHNLQSQIESLESRRTELTTQLATANAQILDLSRFRDRWNEYRIASATFTQTLAHNDPINFVEFFEHIVNHDLVPQDILAVAFAQAQAINYFNEELRMLVSTYNNMEESRAAEDLERLMLIDTDLAVMILRAMGSSRRAAIFDEMEYSVSTIFTVLLSTTPPTFAPLVPPPELPEILPIDIPVIPAPTLVETEYEYETEEIDEVETEEVEEETEEDVTDAEI